MKEISEKKIAIIRPTSAQAPGGSYNIQEIGLAKALAGKGISSDVFLITDKKKEYSGEIYVGDIKIRIFRLKGLCVPGRQAIFFSLFKRLAEQHYDLIQVLEDSQITSVMVSRYGRKKNIPVILWQGMYEDYRDLYKKVIQRIYDMIFLPVLRKNITCTISKTDKAKAYLERKGFKNNYLGLVGLDDEAFKVDAPGSEWIRSLGIPEENDILLYVGCVEKRRKTDLLIDIFYEIVKKRNNTTLVIVGRGPYENLIKNKIKELNLGKKIRYIKSLPQDDVRKLYKHAKCFLLTTDYEIFGMVVLESMYHGVPVVSSPAAGPQQVIKDGVDGVLIGTWEKAVWSSKVIQLLDNEAQRSIMAEKASSKVKTQYLWGEIVKRYIRIYGEQLD